MLNYLQHTRFNSGRFDLKSYPDCYGNAQHKPTVFFIGNEIDLNFLRPDYIHA